MKIEELEDNVLRTMLNEIVQAPDTVEQFKAIERYQKMVSAVCERRAKK